LIAGADALHLGPLWLVLAMLFDSLARERPEEAVSYFVMMRFAGSLVRVLDFPEAAVDIRLGFDGAPVVADPPFLRRSEKSHESNLHVQV
jgi:hypothetical protein